MIDAGLGPAVATCPAHHVRAIECAAGELQPTRKDPPQDLPPASPDGPPACSTGNNALSEEPTARSWRRQTDAAFMDFAALAP